MKALILSGGTGTRLRPVTYSNAKQLVPVANKPILFYIIEKVVKAGIDDIGIIVSHTKDEIENAVGDGSRWGVKITYIHQPQPLGLAHAVKTARPFTGDDDFMMILGDNLFSMDLDSLMDKFHSTRSNAAILLHRAQNPQEFGVAVVEGDCIVRLVEKPKDFISDLIITGVYIFDKTVFPAIDEIKPSKRGELEITDAIQRLLEKGGTVSYSLITGWWKDTGKLCDILEANRLALDEIEGDTGTPADCTSSVNGVLHAGKNVTIKDSIIEGPVILGDNAFISNSFLGPHTSIGNGAAVINCKIEDSIVMEGTHLENISERIHESLIGKNSVIKGTGEKPLLISLFVGDRSEVYI